MSKQAVQSCVGIIWTGRCSGDSTLSACRLARCQRLEVIGVSSTSAEHELITTSRRGIIVESDGWSSAGSNSQWKGADRSALLTGNSDWISANSGGRVGDRVWFDTTLLDSRTVRVHPTSDCGILEDRDAKWTRARARFRVDLRRRDSSRHNLAALVTIGLNANLSGKWACLSISCALDKGGGARTKSNSWRSRSRGRCRKLSGTLWMLV